jgi:hypothetical protein
LLLCLKLLLVRCLGARARRGLAKRVRLIHSRRASALHHRLRLRSNGAREPLRTPAAALLLWLSASAKRPHETANSAADAATALRSAATTDHAANSARSAADGRADAGNHRCDRAARLEEGPEHVACAVLLGFALAIALGFQFAPPRVKLLGRLRSNIASDSSRLPPSLALRDERVCALGYGRHLRLRHPLRSQRRLTPLIL